jgi:CRP/FNR family cyclic AMP-dependent transcriptional regulator
MVPVETYLQQAGLALVSHSVDLSALGPHWLHDSPLLEDCTPEEAGLLGAAMLLVRARPGQVLVTEGEVGDWMMLVLSGTVDVTRCIGAQARPDDASPGAAGAAGGEIVRLAVIRAGAALGEMSMLEGEPRYTTCTAIDAVEIGIMTRAAIARLIHDHPAVGAKLLVKLTQLLARRLRNTSNQLTRMLEKR